MALDLRVCSRQKSWLVLGSICIPNADGLELSTSKGTIKESSLAPALSHDIFLTLSLEGHWYIVFEWVATRGLFGELVVFSKRKYRCVFNRVLALYKVFLPWYSDTYIDARPTTYWDGLTTLPVGSNPFLFFCVAACSWRTWTRERWVCYWL